MSELINIITNPSDKDNNIIFNLIKNNDTQQAIKMIRDTKMNLNIKDENSNYLIHYVINYNNSTLFKEFIDNNARLDVLDSDNRTILFNIIKFDYQELLKQLLKVNKTHVGISLLDIKDKNGLTALHQCILYNNFKIFKILLENSANPYISDNNNSNCIMMTIIYNRDEMIKYFIDNKYRMNIMSSKNETLLQVALNHQNEYAIKLLLVTNIDLNNQDTENGFTLLMQSVVSNNLNLFIDLLDSNVNVNIQDFYGNTILHLIQIEKNYKFLDILMNKQLKLNYNHTNYNGETPLHIILEQNINDIKTDILEQFIKNTDLNIMNNSGVTCLLLLYNNNLLEIYKYLLIHKPLNFFIKSNNNKMIDTTLHIDIVVESYYNQLLQNKEKLKPIKKDEWEYYCANSIIDKLKKISNFTNIKDICKDKIKEIILKEKRSLPQLINLDLKLDNGIFVNTCYYTGFPIDILFGLLVLAQNFPNLGLILDYPLTVNQKLEEFYKTNGTDFPYKLDFSNIEIIWSYQKIFYPSYFDEIIKKQMKEKNYIVIPIGIEMSNGSHANILFWDIVNKTIERFEPNGANTPLGFNYNSNFLDSLLKIKFQQFDANITYYAPSKFLPSIGFQILENLETDKCKRIGDPNGFCGVWSIWWVYQRLLNIDKNLELNDIANKLIQYIKYDGKQFKNIIRDFSSKITDMRDSYLSKYNLDINDWANNNYSKSDLENLEKDIFKSI